MKILGIETSCDETASAVVKDGRDILTNIVYSSLKEHKKYGGIVPEIASRSQLEVINTVVQRSLDKAKIRLKEIDAIAVTTKPGLIGSLLVGISFARALAFFVKKPLIEVDHIKAHIYANFLAFRKTKKGSALNKIPRLPAIGLVISGGHTSIFKINQHYRYRLLGQTRDDAAGETFDKVSRILGLGYPGGPIIERLASQGENSEIHFSCADLPGTNDFSFSGIKTGVLYYVRKHINKKSFSTSKIAYSFQNSIINSLVNKAILICRKNRIRTLLVGGGVAANFKLRDRCLEVARNHKINVFFPQLPLCMDNAAMIAGLGYQILFSKNKGCECVVR